MGRFFLFLTFPEPGTGGESLGKDMSSVFSEFPPEADPDLTASCERARPSEEARQRVEEVTGREEALCRVYSQAGDPRGALAFSLTKNHQS